MFWEKFAITLSQRRTPLWVGHLIRRTTDLVPACRFAVTLLYIYIYMTDFSVRRTVGDGPDASVRLKRESTVLNKHTWSWEWHDENIIPFSRQCWKNCHLFFCYTHTTRPCIAIKYQRVSKISHTWCCCLLQKLKYNIFKHWIAYRLYILSS